MLNRMKVFLGSPRQRRQAEVAASGALIAAGLLAKFAFGLVGLHDGLMTAAALVAGADIAARALASLRNRHVSIELLVTVATVGALAIGEVWEAAAVTFLFVLGAYLEARTLARTRKVLGDLLDLAPLTALVLRDGRQVEVDPLEVQPGETVLLKPGMKVPVDGEVIGGASAVDESMITGEPMPEEKTAGALVYAGTVNLEGALTVRTTGAGADTTLARIIARVEEAQEEKAPTQRFVERFARWYTPAIIVLSAAVYLLTRSIELALTLLVIACPGALVISTPVSVIAGIGQAARRGILIKGGEYLENAGRVTAVAFDKTGTITHGKPQVTDVVALGVVEAQYRPSPSFAREHLLPGEPGLFRAKATSSPEGRGAKISLPTGEGGFAERSLREGRYWQINTRDGTDRPSPSLSPEGRGVGIPLPEGEGGFAERSLSEGVSTSTNPLTPAQAELLYYAGIAESASEHPLARAITQSAGRLGTLPQPDDFQTFTGMGVQARYAGRLIQAGRPEWLADQGIRLPEEAGLPEEAWEQAGVLREDGKTVVLVALDGRPLGLLGIADRMRPGAPQALAQLRAAGVKRVVMLTGDDARTARAIARQAGIEDARAGLLPEDKLEAVRALQREGHVVAMVGDGINDAPALAAADIGIAMGAAGSGVAIETAGIALMADDLARVAQAIDLSRATARNIRQNLAVALLTVTVLLAGVLLDRVHMAGGMLVHQASVLVVIANGMRLLRI